MMLTDQEIIQRIPSACVNDDTELFSLTLSELVTFARAVIEANNAKVLADLKPVGFLHEGGYFLKVTQSDNPVYSADTVSALIQRNEALEARLKELERLHRLYAAN